MAFVSSIYSWLVELRMNTTELRKMVGAKELVWTPEAQAEFDWIKAQTPRLEKRIKRLVDPNQPIHLELD